VVPAYAFPSDPDEVLLTERLRLEPIRADHAPLLFELWQEAAIYAYVPEEPPVSLAWLTERYRKLETRQSAAGDQAWLQWAVRLRDASTTPTYVGRVEATVEPSRPTALAWMLGSPWWREGVGTEAVTKVMDHLAVAWGVTRVSVEIDERNTASLALASRLGYVEFARVPDADFFKGTTSHERHLARSLASARPLRLSTVADRARVE
jgi:ribosomal-protein-alanine N-acetyltransferase